MPVTIGDMTTTRVPGTFALVYLVANSHEHRSMTRGICGCDSMTSNCPHRVANAIKPAIGDASTQDSDRLAQRWAQTSSGPSAAPRSLPRSVSR